MTDKYQTRQLSLLTRLIHKVFRKIPSLYSDKSFTTNQFFVTFNRYPDLVNPITFNEKINYKKLYDRNPLLNIAADKIAVRDYVKNIIGEDYLPKVLKIFRTSKEISFDNLPDQFIVKASHGSGWFKVVNDIDKENPHELKSICEEWLRINYYYISREWCYKDVKPGIIIEELLQEDGELPTDYKLFCFHGKVRLIAICYQRHTQKAWNFYNEKGELIDLRYEIFENNPNISSVPNNGKDLIKIAERLSMDFDFIRVDLYNIRGKIYFGELTNYPGNGYNHYHPDAFDKTLGSYWRSQEY